MVRPYTVGKPFRFWCQKILPLVYDDSLSYYELLNKVVDYLNKVINNVDSIGEAFNDLGGRFESLQSSFNELSEMVDNYFDNLDVQQEINNKLDEMAQDGTLDALIQPLVDSAVSDAVTDWLEENVNPAGSAVVVDSSLTVSGAAADAKVTGDEIRNLKSDLRLLETPYEQLFGNPTFDPGKEGASVTFGNVTYSNGVYTFDTTKSAFTYRSNVMHALSSSKSYVFRIKAKAKNDANNGIIFTLNLTQSTDYVIPSNTNIYVTTSSPSDGMYDIVYAFKPSINAASPRLSFVFTFTKNGTAYAGSNVDIEIYNISICECESTDIDILHDLLKHCPDDIVGVLPAVNYSLKAYDAERVSASGVMVDESTVLPQTIADIYDNFDADNVEIAETNSALNTLRVPYANLFGNPTMNPDNTEAHMSFTNITYSNGVYTFDATKYSFTYRSDVLGELKTGKQYIFRIKAKAKNNGNNGIVINTSLVQSGSFIFPSTNILSKMSGSPADGQYDFIYPFTVSVDGATPRLTITFSFVKDATWYAASDVDITIYNISIVECSEQQRNRVYELLKVSPDNTVGVFPVANQAEKSLYSEQVKYPAFGKRVLVLGDSIFSLGYEYVAENIETMLHPSVYKNVAVPGAKICDTSASQVYDGNPTTGNANNVLGNQVQKVLNNKQSAVSGFDDFDICIISAGANDGPASWGWDGPKPTYQGWIVPTDEDIESFFTGDVNAGSTGSFIDLDLIDRQSPIGALRWSVEKLMSAYPHMNVFICNPIQCAQGDAGSNYLTNIHKCDTISRVAMRLAAVSIPNERCGIYGRFETWGENGRYLQDGLHPNADGGMLLARFVCDEIIKYYTVGL